MKDKFILGITTSIYMLVAGELWLIKGQLSYNEELLLFMVYIVLF